MTIASPEIPPQSQKRQPAQQHALNPQPISVSLDYRPAGKLQGKVALITGGDSGIGRAVALHYVLEGADVAITYHPSEEVDVQDTARLLGTPVEQLLCVQCWKQYGGPTRLDDKASAEGHRCAPLPNCFHRTSPANILLIPCNLAEELDCRNAIERVKQHYGRLDILICNAAVQYMTTRAEDIDAAKLEHVFKVNVFSIFYLVRDVLAAGLLGEGSIIISTSIQTYKGEPAMLEYASSKGALTAFIRSICQLLVMRNIRVNGVAPGPIWTPLIASSYPEEALASFGRFTPMGRYGMPAEVAPCYVFLAASDTSYMAGQILHPNGGIVVNG